MDDGYRAVRAVIYRDIARVVVMLALLAAVVWTWTSPAQEWQVKAIGVPAGSTAVASTILLYRNGDSFATSWNGGSGVVVAELVVTTRRSTYGSQQFPSGRYLVEGEPVVTSSIHMIYPVVSLKDVEAYVNSNPDLVRTQRVGAIEYLGAAPTPPPIGLMMWKYAQLPFWCGVAILAIILWLLRPRVPRMLRRSRNGHCWKCDYDLDSTLPICPECGSKGWKSSLDLFRRVPLTDSPPPR